MDYLSRYLLPSPAVHLGRRADLANMNVHVYIYGFRYKNEWGRRKVYLSTLLVPWRRLLSVNISRQPCQGFMWRWQWQDEPVQLFPSAPYQSCVETNETDNAHSLNLALSFARKRCVRKFPRSKWSSRTHMHAADFLQGVTTFSLQWQEVKSCQRHVWIIRGDFNVGFPSIQIFWFTCIVVLIVHPSIQPFSDPLCPYKSHEACWSLSQLSSTK